MTVSLSRRNVLKAAIAGAGCGQLSFLARDARGEDFAFAASALENTDTIPDELRALGVTEDELKNAEELAKKVRFGSCEEISPSYEEQEEATKFAQQENPDNADRIANSMAAHGFADTDPGRVASALADGDVDFGASAPEAQAIFNGAKLWGKNRPITWCFVTKGYAFQDSSETQKIRQAVETAFKEWGEILGCVGITKLNDDATAPFSNSTANPSSRADIRISMLGDGTYRSLLGTDSRISNLFRTNIAASLNMSPSSRGLNQSEYTRLARHEIGHALGMEHEHRHAIDSIKWIEAKVYSYYYQRYKWSAAQTKSQIIDRVNVGVGFSTNKRDRASVMNYWFPSELHNNGNTVPTEPQMVISDVDRIFAREKYGCSPGDKPNPNGEVKPNEPTPSLVRHSELNVDGSGRVGERISKPRESVLYKVVGTTLGTHRIETFEDKPSITMKLSLFDSDDIKKTPLAIGHHNGERLLNARIDYELKQGQTYYVLAEHFFKTQTSVGEFNIRAIRP